MVDVLSHYLVAFFLHYPGALLPVALVLGGIGIALMEGERK